MLEELRGAERTMLVTLWMHALDAQAARPILGDHEARRVMDALDVDVSGLGPEAGARGNLPVVVARARQVDDWTATALTVHPDAQVLHLGCGLDSRSTRLTLPPDVTWWDLDQRAVVALRRRVYDDGRGAAGQVRTVVGSAADPTTWPELEAGRPVVVVAEGLLMYLDAAGVTRLVDAAATRGGPVTIIADTVRPWVRGIAAHAPTFRRLGAGFASVTTDLIAATARHPGLERVDHVGIPELARDATTGAIRAFLVAFDLVPAARESMELHLYRRG